MPLIVFCGLPSSGKTTRATELYDYLRKALQSKENALVEGKNATLQQSNNNETLFSKIQSVVLINDESLRISRKLAYSSMHRSFMSTLISKETTFKILRHNHHRSLDPTEEKKARSAFMSAVERALTDHTIVIADGMNYIKGYRYQLYCSVREQHTTHCVVHCATPVEQVRTWNQERSAGCAVDPNGDSTASRHQDAYEPQALEELVMRFEEPIEFNRWDKPLITVQPEDDADWCCQRICTALLQRAEMNVSFTHIPKQVTCTEHLYKVDQHTQTILQAVMDVQRQQLTDMVRVPHTDTTITLQRSVPLAELRRLRKQFLDIHRKHPIQPEPAQVAKSFMEYLKMHLE